MTEAEWDAEVDKVTQELRDHQLFGKTPVLMGVVAVLQVEFVHGPRENCGKPAPTGLCKSPAKGSSRYRMDPRP